jgi:hypothetical protein
MPRPRTTLPGAREAARAASSFRGLPLEYSIFRVDWRMAAILMRSFVA